MILKPYAFRADAPPKQRNFNYALSKSRRVVENAFGHLKARFRRIGKGVDNHIDHVKLIVKCCCVLHNFLNDNHDVVNQQWLQQMNEHESNTDKQQPDEVVTITDTEPMAYSIRESIANYLCKFLFFRCVFLLKSKHFRNNLYNKIELFRLYTSSDSDPIQEFRINEFNEIKSWPKYHLA